MSALANEFDQLREDSSKLQFWYTLFWEHGTTGLEDWALVDAWYRSRCLELPHTGVAMVPGLDMANHSPSPTAYYEEDGKGDVALLMRQDRGVSCGDEISISYGEAKSAGEMLFSYGFIDKDSNAQEMTLHLNTLPDDPLAMAKLHVFGGPPAVKFFVSNEEFSWDCQFVYLMCVNEEDGLDLQVVQDAEGNRHLRLFWQEDDVTERARDFKTLIQGHPLCQVFKLRAVAVLLDRVETQLDRIGSEMFHNMAESLGATDPPKESCIRAVELLRENETKILTGVAKVLEHQVRGYWRFLLKLISLRKPWRRPVRARQAYVFILRSNHIILLVNQHAFKRREPYHFLLRFSLSREFLFIPFSPQWILKIKANKPT